MKLKEFEGMQLFEKSGIPVAKGTLVTDVKDIPDVEDEVVVKVQTLTGGRGKAGGVRFCKKDKVKDTVEEFLGNEILGEKVTEVLIQDKLDAQNEYYLGFMFDTKLRSPVIIISKEGGVDIEETKEKTPEKVIVEEINALEGLPAWKAREIAAKTGLNDKVAEVAVKLYDCFKENDMKMVEINPLIEDVKGNLSAADAVVVLDDDALKRHDFDFPERTGFREKTDRELRANAIDKEDYRGVAGRTFIDIEEGDIAVMSSGGGASVVAMDSLLSYDAMPANYTEYSGNPSEEKVYKLTKVVLDKENLAGCFVVGGRANFTRIDITLKGFLDALEEIKPDYPILIRRAGPKMEEAFEMIKEFAKMHKLNIHLYDDSIPISVAAQKMVELAKRYRNEHLS